MAHSSAGTGKHGPLAGTGKHGPLAGTGKHGPLAGTGKHGPLAAKVPEITFLFWIIKLLTTAGGEATSDYLALHGDLVAGAAEVAIFVIAVFIQFSVRRYVAAAYWFLALAIAIFGTGVADAMHLIIGIPYGGTTALWACILAIIFWVWYRSEGTLSIHSITTTRRELFYWATVFATFALGTALGDFTASVLHLGYLGSAVVFFVVILLPAAAWRLGMNPIAAFWWAYVTTRPLGASFADYFSKPHDISGLNYGDGPTAVVTLALFVVLVGYTAIARNDIQRDIQRPPAAARLGSTGRGDRGRADVTRNVSTDPARDQLQ